jgi:hypothetical protein
MRPTRAQPCDAAQKLVNIKFQLGHMSGDVAECFGNWLLSSGLKATVLSASKNFASSLKTIFTVLTFCLGDFAFSSLATF